MQKEKILVLCVDRDDDLGTKTGIKGPIIGKENILKAAEKLGIADPEDSDLNAMFQAIKISDEISSNSESKPVVLTGSRKVGIDSDRKIVAQLSHVLKSFPAKHAVLVTDGVADEHVLPLIQSRIPILSVNRVIVKQSERLESAYYKVKDFLDDTLKDPHTSKLFIGLPALALLLLAIFGIEAGRLILGIVAIYLIIKGFKIETWVTSALDEFKLTLLRHKGAFFSYIVALIIFVLGSYKGYESVLGMEFGMQMLSVFLIASIPVYYVSGLFGWVGFCITRRRKRKTMVSGSIFGLALTLIVYNASKVIISPEIAGLSFLISIIIGIILVLCAFAIEWKG
ncbi:MAG: DUF373 family protein [Candidatus Aenigmatarchaeota archaeon]